MNEPARLPALSRPAAVAAVAATYFYFLIFAEFALLTLAQPYATAPAGILPMLAVLGGAGIAGSFAGAALFKPDRARRLLAWFFRFAGLGALLAATSPSRLFFFAACALTGLSLGGLTVVLSASLRAAAGPARLGLSVGLGTGFAYGACNLPMIFLASAQWQALVAGGVAFTASFTPLWFCPSGEPPPANADQRSGAAIAWIVMLTALVGLDSAAFYIIQHQPGLRNGTWSEAPELWGNATVHLMAAAIAGWLFDRAWRGRLLACAALLLVSACGMLAAPVGGPAPRILYTAGVSLYSVVLVAYPAQVARPWFSARMFALAGWIGSALGIGLVLQSSRLPTGGIVAAVGLLAGALLVRHRALRNGLVILAVLSGLPKSGRAGEPDTAVIRGREVYIAEGCINCHSQYVRPQVATDVERWGPASGPDDQAGESPPLLGNRRQGPDLANVGLRRSPAWNRLHLLQPQSVSPGSVMPVYAHLFAAGNSRGPDLLAYLSSLGLERAEERIAFISRWRPGSAGSGGDAGPLFTRLCANCHGTTGHGDGRLSGALAPTPPDWRTGPRYHPAPDEDARVFLARVIKFGLPHSPMAGHEYLPDSEVLGLARYVQSLQSTAAAGPPR